MSEAQVPNLNLQYSTSKKPQSKNNTIVLVQSTDIDFSSNIDTADKEAFGNAIANNIEDFLKKEGYTIKQVYDEGANIRDRSDASLSLQVKGDYTIYERNTKTVRDANGFDVTTGKHELGGKISLLIKEPLTGELLDSLVIDLAKLKLSGDFSKATKAGSGDLLFGLFSSAPEDNYKASIANILNLSYPKIVQALDNKISKGEFDSYNSHIKSLKSKKIFN